MSILTHEGYSSKAYKDKGDKVFKYYIVDNKVYDFTEWIPKHPGGTAWFSRAKGRDISAVVHTYHP
jgi:cytochrome b involved in lipid metabolism